MEINKIKSVVGIIRADNITNLRDLLTKKIETSYASVNKFEVWKEVAAPVRRQFVFPTFNYIRVKLSEDNYFI